MQNCITVPLTQSMWIFLLTMSFPLWPQHKNMPFSSSPSSSSSSSFSWLLRGHHRENHKGHTLWPLSRHVCRILFCHTKPMRLLLTTSLKFLYRISNFFVQYVHSPCLRMFKSSLPRLSKFVSKLVNRFAITSPEKENISFHSCCYPSVTKKPWNSSILHTLSTLSSSCLMWTVHCIG